MGCIKRSASLSRDSHDAGQQPVGAAETSIAETYTRYHEARSAGWQSDVLDATGEAPVQFLQLVGQQWSVSILPRLLGDEAHIPDVHNTKGRRHRDRHEEVVVEGPTLQNFELLRQPGGSRDKAAADESIATACIRKKRLL